MNVSTAITFGIPEQTPAWYLMHCQSRQDERAEANLLRQVRQGYGCYRSQYSRGRIVRSRRQTIVESLFPGYLFIQLAAYANWAPLRSARGVNRIVGFGSMPLPLDNGLIRHLLQHAATTVKPAIVVGNGMCSSGRIVNYLKAMLSGERPDVLFVGYQAEVTIGRQIQCFGPHGGYVAMSGSLGWVCHQDALMAVQLGIVHADPSAKQTPHKHCVSDASRH